MKILFDKVHIENFMSFGCSDVTLSDGGYTLINGKNLNPNDSASSNGAGKTTILEAISYALTGETIRGTKDVVNKYGTDGTLIELDFLVDNNTYKVIRTKDHSKYKTNLKLFVNGEDKSGKGIRDTQKIFEQYLPNLTPSFVGSVIILGQGMPYRFTNNTPSGRKEVLESLSKSDFMIEDLKNRINDRKTELSKNLRECEDSLLKDNSIKSLLQSQINEYSDKLKSIPNTDDIEKASVELTLAIDKLETNKKDVIATIEENKTRYSDILSKKNDTINLITAANNEKLLIMDKKSGISKDVADEQRMIEAEFDAIISNLVRDQLVLSTDIKNKINEINKAKNIKDVCPTCGQKLPNVFKPDTSDLEKSVEEDKISLQKISEDINIAKVKKEESISSMLLKYKDRIDEIQKDIDNADLKIRSIEKDVRTIDERASETEMYISEQSGALSRIERNIELNKEKLNKLLLERSTVDDMKKSLVDSINASSLKISEIDKDISNKEADKLSIESHINAVNKMSTIITRDFRGYLLKNIIEFIEKRAKEYSLDVFNTDKVGFELDGNNIAITYDGKDYESLSGGEKAKCDIIIQFSIRDMLCKFTGFSSNILALDEICDNIDSFGVEKLFNMISKKLTDVQSVFIITHHSSDLQIPFDHIIEVTKGADKLSKITHVV